MPTITSKTYRLDSKVAGLEQLVHLGVEQCLAERRGRRLRHGGAETVEHASEEAARLLALLLR